MVGTLLPSSAIRLISSFFSFFFLHSCSNFSASECRFVCDNPAELEELVESLHPQGVRESELKAKIQNRCLYSHESANCFNKYETVQSCTAKGLKTLNAKPPK